MLAVGEYCLDIFTVYRHIPPLIAAFVRLLATSNSYFSSHAIRQQKELYEKSHLVFCISVVFFFGWPIQVTFNGLAEEKPSIRPNCQYPAMSYVAEPFYFLFPISDVILTIPTSWHVKLLFISNAIFIFH